MVTRGFRPSKSSLQYQRPSGPLTTMVVSEPDWAPIEMRPPLKFRRTSGASEMEPTQPEPRRLALILPPATTLTLYGSGRKPAFSENVPKFGFSA